MRRMSLEALRSVLVGLMHTGEARWRCGGLMGSGVQYLPYEMPFVGHRPDSIHGTATGLELEVAVCFAALAA